MLFGPSFSWCSLGACLALKHLDLSGCEKITDYTLKKLSVGLGDLASPTIFENRSDRRAKLLKSPPMPITLLGERNLRSVGRKRQALVFKQKTGYLGTTCTPIQVWVLNSSELADIEDTAEWSRRGGVSVPDGKSFVETQLGGGLCCCRRSRRRGLRTGFSTSYLQQQYAMSGETLCGHSTCCSGEMALRTFTGLQCESRTTRGSAADTAEFRTKCSFGGQQCLERGNRTDQTQAKRSLRFLSLSGCYQVTDLGLR